MDTKLSAEHKKLFDELMFRVDGVERWSARDLMNKFGYSSWERFRSVIRRAMIDAQKQGYDIKVLFHQAVKQHSKQNQHNEYTVGKPDYHVSRFGAYLIAINANSSQSNNVAAAHVYFTIQTYRQEIADQRAVDWERHYERDQNLDAERLFSQVILQRDVTSPELATIRSDGDRAFYNGLNTAGMKKRMNLPSNRSIADFLPTRLLVAKTAAAQMTISKVEKNNLRGKRKISTAHVGSNQFTRKLLMNVGLVPENTQAELDIRQVRIRLGISTGPRKVVAPGQLSLL